MFWKKFAIIVSGLLGSLQAAEIAGCPKIEASQIPAAKNVYDLHPSHIKIIASIGDSITSGVGAKNIEKPFAALSDFKQWRGLSWLNGGDEDATSIANYIKHYSPSVYGSSHGMRDMAMCPDTFFCLKYEHDFEVDQLNAALPSAVSSSFVDQVNYLIKYIGNGTAYDNDWKMINVFLGSNDISVSCMPGYREEDFNKNMRAGLDLIKEKIPKVIVNLVSIFHTEKIVRREQPGYRKLFEHSPELNPRHYESLCSQIPVFGDIDLSAHVEQFNRALEKIGRDYHSTPFNSFTATFRNLNIDIDSIPYYALSNLDEFHPNVHMYHFMSKVLWNQMLDPRANPSERLEFNEDLPLYCVSAADRFRT
ncbi:hypothetical protein DM01DRAFT_1334798 [Hesseltinella vesiculosa]|uniref:SGNH hydrolase n=1 Tax=Hesseltinella vesiculosa TaxID=101127 RepID=A0A1X2GL61_9FUNG|nr:hypothetical protein DM01DRAFT_1334798 [Hesseltinella vesiculosa]